MMPSSERRVVDGVILLDKAKGLSSNKALQQVKHFFQAKKAGHCGTLDPLATGMLPICLGQATKYAQYLIDSDKSYLATASLGVTTTTGDAEGEVVSTVEGFRVTKAQLLMALSNFLGQIEQVPPMYSALKHHGKPLYQLAREGKEVERKRRTVTIHALELLAFDGRELQLMVRCSKGTYIRTLVEDIAKDLGGIGAHLTDLRRLAVSPFVTDEMQTFERLNALGPAEVLKQYLQPVGSLLRALPKMVLSDVQAGQLRTAKQLYLTPFIEGKVQFCSLAGDFLGVGELDQEGRVIHRRLMAG